MVYSKRNVKEKISSTVKNYELAINQMEIFMKSEYAQSINKNIYLNLNLKWAVKAMQILEEVEAAIENEAMDRSIVFSFKELIKECDKEEANIEDTYKLVPFSEEQGFSDFEVSLMKLRELCYEISFFDDMVTTLDAYCKEGINPVNNTNNFYGNVKDIQIQQGTTNSSQNQYVTETFDYEKVIGLISSIRQYDTFLDNEYKENATVVKDKLLEIEELATQKRDSGKIKTLLADLKSLSLGISESVIASGIVSLISTFL